MIASRQLPGARRLGESPLRYFLSRIFNSLVRLLGMVDFSDTQCGFKCFRGDAADLLFRLQRTTGWSFDVEILYLARRRNMRIAELPIACHHDRAGIVHGAFDGAGAALGHRGDQVARPLRGGATVRTAGQPGEHELPGGTEGD